MEQAIEKLNAKLVILDPIQAYLGAEVDMHRANEIRPVMKRLGAIAEKHQCAIVLIGHMNKASGSKSTYRGLGSIDFQAAARSVLVVGRLIDDINVRVIAHEKSSLAPEGKSIAFRLSDNSGFEWLGECEISVDELLSGVRQESKLKKAEVMLKEVLSQEEVLQSEIAKKAEELQISKRVLDQAKKNVSVESFRKGGRWFWKLHSGF